MPSVLVTGGAGYIGTHILLALAAAGRHAVCLDNYSNSSPAALERVSRIAPGMVEAVEGDIRDGAALKALVAGHDIDSVIHLAGLKAVGESVEQPERYRDNNVRGTATLLDALRGLPAGGFVFSSSATVYGAAAEPPFSEASPTAPLSPYADNKLAAERMLGDFSRSAGWRVVSLRYFNPVGAHESGLIGEDPRGVPANLMPSMCQVAAGRLKELRILGNDYPTRDGTGVRDYLHVMDLAEGHVAALAALRDLPAGSAQVVNLGTGRGVSVLELVETFERVNAVRIARVFAPRRPGDVAVSYADASLAGTLLRWQARRGIDAMCRDAWRWQVANPAGYSFTSSRNRPL